MKKYQDDLNKIKESLENFFQKIKEYEQATSFHEKNKQLRSIQKSISMLEKSNTPIPEEIRILKFRLLKELEGYNEVRIAKEKLSEIIDFYFPKKRILIKTPLPGADPKDISKSGIKIIDLINRKILNADTKIERIYKRKLYTGKIDQDGDIIVEIDGKPQKFKSPSGAARGITKRAIDGWKWWRISGKTKNHDLDYYRNKYLNNET